MVFEDLIQRIFKRLKMIWMKKERGKNAIEEHYAILSYVELTSQIWKTHEDMKNDILNKKDPFQHQLPMHVDERH